MPVYRQKILQTGFYNNFPQFAESFEEEMRRQSIPYRIYGGLSFYQRKEIKEAP